MPIYEYDCPECGRIEAIQKVSDKPLKLCPNCEEKGKQSKVTKVVSQAAFHLKGSGWYKTDYATSGSKDSAKAKPAADAKEAGTSGEAKSDTSDAKKKPAKACNPGCGCH